MTNVVSLPVRKTILEPVQLDLFQGDAPVLEFWDLSQSNQEGFLSFLSLNSIKSVMDTRETVTFPKYEYQHKEIFRYFHSYGINYENTFEAIRSLQDSSISLWLMRHGKEFKKSIQETLCLGSSVVLYDARKNIELAELYRKLVLSQFGVAERKMN